MSKATPAAPEWLAARTAGRPVGVDREAKVLRGYVLAQEGPFKSEGRGEFDKASLEAIVSLGNAKAAGLKARFTHPDLSSDGLGKFLGRARGLYLSTARDERTGKNVRAVRGDLHFDETALQEPPGGGKPYGTYIMDLAESDPAALSSSLVLKTDEEYRREKDGSLAKGPDGEPLPPLWRPSELHASDIVDIGDAVDAILSPADLAESLAGPGRLDLNGLVALAARALDGTFKGQSRSVIEARLTAWLGRYLDRRFPAEATPVPDVQPLTPRLDARALRMARMALHARASRA